MLIANAILFCHPVNGQGFDVRFARTAATGHWSDGEWENPDGNTTTTPPSVAQVFIGTAITPDSSLPATVDLYKTSTISELTIGPDFGTDTGTLNILTGAAPGDVTTTGDLTVSGSLVVQQGTISLSGGGSLSSGAMTVSSSLSLASIDGMAMVSSFEILDGADVVLGSAGSLISSGDLMISGGTLMMAGSSTVSASKLLLNSATASSTLSGNISIDEVEVSNGATLSVGNTLASTRVEVNNGTVNVDADVTAANALDMSDTVVHLNAGTLKANNAVTLDNTVINRNGGSLDLHNLTMIGALTNLAVEAGDQLSGTVHLEDNSTLVSSTQLDLGIVDISSSSSFMVVQALGDREGITMEDLMIEAGSEFEAVFDNVANEGLDWALRLVGDQQTELQSMLDDGRVTASGGVLPISVIYDSSAYGDFTFLGSFVEPIPEPGSASLLGLIGIVGLVKRRRSKLALC